MRKFYDVEPTAHDEAVIAQYEAKRPFRAFRLMAFSALGGALLPSLIHLILGVLH